MSIRTRFIIIIGTVSLIAMIAFALLSYQFTIQASLAEAKQKGIIVSTFLDAAKSFFRHEQRPLITELVDKDRFYPNIMSGFAITRGVWDEFYKKLPDYRFKQATIDPLYPPNKADSDEYRLIAEFDANADLETKEGIMEKGGERFFYFAEPVKVKKGCLRCHGDPKDAPKDQITLYGTQNGYNWQIGKTVAAYIIYVPIQKAIDAARKSALTLGGFGLVGITLLSLVIWFSLQKYLVKPITRLEERATEISVGKNLDEKIELISNDEVGALGQAIERMRISVTKLIEQCTTKQ